MSDQSADHIAQDTVSGIAAIAAFTGFSERQTHYLASKGLLPGAFQMGRSWNLLKSIYVADIRARASRGTARQTAAE